MVNQTSKEPSLLQMEGSSCSPGNNTRRRSCQMKRKSGVQPGWTPKQVQRDDTRATRTVTAACWEMEEGKRMWQHFLSECWAGIVTFSCPQHSWFSESLALRYKTLFHLPLAQHKKSYCSVQVWSSTMCHTQSDDPKARQTLMKQLIWRQKDF